MTPAEFKSWFEGFTEALSGVPTKAQWARIKARVGEIDGAPVTEKGFIDRYWPRYYAPFYSPATTGYRPVHRDPAAFSASSAMYALGKADAASLSA